MQDGENLGVSTSGGHLTTEAFDKSPVYKEMKQGVAAEMAHPQGAGVSGYHKQSFLKLGPKM